jgi:signal transduction histidine kinase
LSIAKWIANAHHATITLVSAPGVGTTVTVRFGEEGGRRA